ncbi:hypothetical protein MMC22_002862 [Lobaria immixta]|nr:hypothetical protein [Lobaria immixta]
MFTQFTVTLSFKKTGLVPYDPNMVLHKITAIQSSQRCQATSSPPQAEWHARTPRTSKEVIDFGIGLHKHVSRFVKGALASAHSLEISNRDLELLHQTAVQKAARKKLDGRVAHTGGVILVGDVRAKAAQHDKDELAKATRAYERALGVEQKKQLASLNAEKKTWKGLFSEARSHIAARKKLEVEQRKRVRVIKKSIAYISAWNVLLGIEDKSIIQKFIEAEQGYPLPRKEVQGYIVYASGAFDSPSSKSIGKPLLSDFDSAFSGNVEHDEDVQPNVYMAPKVCLKAPWSYSIDIWNVGQAHILRQGPEGKEIHDSRSSRRNIALMGHPPPELLKKGKRTAEFFDEDGQWRDEIPLPDRTSLEESKENFEGRNEETFLRLVRRMVQWRP